MTGHQQDFSNLVIVELLRDAGVEEVNIIPCSPFANPIYWYFVCPDEVPGQFVIEGVRVIETEETSFNVLMLSHAGGTPEEIVRKKASYPALNLVRRKYHAVIVRPIRPDETNGDHRNVAMLLKAVRTESYLVEFQVHSRKFF